MNQLPNVYAERNLTGMRTTDPFLQGFAFGRELVKDYRGEKERLANQKKWAEIIEGVKANLDHSKNKQLPNGVIA